MRRTDVVEVTERIDAFGDVIVPLDLRRGRRRPSSGCSARASRRWRSATSGATSTRSTRTGRSALLERALPGVYVSYGSRLAQRIGEYPRAATAVMNSYIGPLMRDYVTTLLAELRRRGYGDRLLFAQCDGGLIDAEELIERPIMTLESGPVGGVVACTRAGAEAGHANIIAADMGGTTFDVSVIDGGRLPVRDGVVVEQHDLFLRMVDVESVGAGGGSLAWVDPQSGALRVGPQSAGAEPGPGLLRPRRHGPDRHRRRPRARPAQPRELPRRPDAARRRRRARGGRARWASGSGSALLECAAGIQEVADSLMEDKIRSMTIARGHDPRDFVLYAFGGGGAVHAGLFTRGLGDRPGRRPGRRPGLGLVGLRDRAGGLRPIYELPAYHARAVRRRASIADGFAALERCARDDAGRSGIDWSSLATRRTADMKYALQVYDVEADGPAGRAAATTRCRAIVDSFERDVRATLRRGRRLPRGRRRPHRPAAPRRARRAAARRRRRSTPARGDDRARRRARACTGRRRGDRGGDAGLRRRRARAGDAPGRARRSSTTPTPRSSCGRTSTCASSAAATSTIEHGGTDDRRAARPWPTSASAAPTSFVDGYIPPDELVIDPSLAAPHRATTRDIDPVTYEVLRSKLWNLNWDHQETIRRVSGSQHRGRRATTSTPRSRPRTATASASARATCSSPASPTRSSSGRSSTAR